MSVRRAAARAAATAATIATIATIIYNSSILNTCTL